MRSRIQGLTLIELIVTVSVLSIVISMAAPAMADMIARNQQLTLRTQIQDALQRARTQAVLHRKTLVVCGSLDSLNCSSDWTDGWIIRDEQTGQVLHVTRFSSHGGLRWNGFGDQRIRFHENGTSPSSNGRFYQCHKQDVAWQLILNRQGRLRLASATENTNNAALCTS